MMQPSGNIVEYDKIKYYGILCTTSIYYVVRVCLRKEVKIG